MSIENKVIFPIKAFDFVKASLCAEYLATACMKLFIHLITSHTNRVNQGSQMAER